MKTLNTLTKLLALVAVVFSSFSLLKAQDDDLKITVKDFSTLTVEQLNDHRTQLMALAASEDFQQKIHKIDDLKAPNDSGIASLDNITVLLGKIAGKVRENRATMTTMYAGVTGFNTDGSKATVARIDPQEMNSVAEIMLQLNGEIMTTAKSLVNLPGEIKGAGAFKALKGLKNLLFIKNAVSALSAEIKYDNQLAQNLVATQRLAMAK